MPPDFCPYLCYVLTDDRFDLITACFLIFIYLFFIYLFIYFFAVLVPFKTFLVFF